MNLDYLTYPIGHSPSLLRTTPCSVVCGFLQTDLCSETDDSRIATPRPPCPGLQSSQVYVVAVAAAVVIVVVVVVVIVVGSESLTVP